MFDWCSLACLLHAVERCCCCCLICSLFARECVCVYLRRFAHGKIPLYYSHIEPCHKFQYFSAQLPAFFPLAVFRCALWIFKIFFLRSNAIFVLCANVELLGNYRKFCTCVCILRCYCRCCMVNAIAFAQHMCFWRSSAGVVSTPHTLTRPFGVCTSCIVHLANLSIFRWRMNSVLCM